MDMYTLLKDRASINILKILYDNETEGKSYSMRFRDVQELLSMKSDTTTIHNLKGAGLITIDHEEKNNIRVLAITKKGKDFIDRFDLLIEAFRGKKEKKKAFKIQYNLTDLEQRILVMARKIRSETGEPITILALAEEVYPYDEPQKKRNTVSRYIRRLAELNLLEIIEKGNEKRIDITKSGERVIREQFIEAKI